MISPTHSAARGRCCRRYSLNLLIEGDIHLRDGLLGNILVGRNAVNILHAETQLSPEYMEGKDA